jgi:hypothetical protein
MLYELLVDLICESKRKLNLGTFESGETLEALQKKDVESEALRAEQRQHLEEAKAASRLSKLKYKGTKYPTVQFRANDFVTLHESSSK